MKKSYLKSLTGLSLAGLMLLSATACQNAPAASAPSASSAAASQSASSENGPQLIDNVYTEGLPIVKDPITVKLVASTTSYSKIPYGERANIKAFTERTNINVDFMEIPSDMAKEKVNIMLASEDLPDGFMRCITTDQLVNNYSSGLFMPLNDLIDELAPNIKGFLEDPTTKAQLELPDGKVYSTPAGEIAPWLSTSAHLYVNKAWLDKLNMEVPKTTEDYYQVLKAFKENDLDGDGKAGNEIPFSFTGVDNLRWLFGCFGVPSDENWLAVNKGVVSFVPVDDRFREGLEYFHKLNAEGLIDAEALSQNLNQMRAKGKDGVLGSYFQLLASSTVGNDRMGDYTHTLPLIGPHGDQLHQQRIYGLSHGLVISAKSPHARALVRWVDYLNTPDTVTHEATFGLEEEGAWTKVDGLKYICNSDKAPSGMSWTEWLSNLGYNTSSPTFQSMEFVEKNRVLDNDQITKDAMARTNEYLQFAVEEILPVTILDEDTNLEVTSIKTEIDALRKNYMATSISDGVTDDGWAKFKSDCEKAGYKRLVEIYQKIYDDYKAGQK